MVNRQVNRRDKDRGGGFVYRAPDAKKMKERAEQKGGNFDSIFVNGVDSWRPKVGDNEIRILPPTFTDHEHFGYEIWTHGYVGADRSTYLCPAKMKGKKCPICAAAKESKEAGEEEEGKALTASKKYIYWIIDRDGDVSTPQIWFVSWSMDRDIAALCHQKKSGKVLLLDHPDEGYDLQFKRVGEGLKTKYIGLQISREATPIDESKKEQRKILEYITENPLDAVLKFRDADYLQTVLDGTTKAKDDDLDDDEDEDDDDDDRKGKKRRGRDRDDDDDDEKPKRRRSRDDDDDEDEDDRPKKRRRDDDDEDDDDEPKSRRRRSRDDDEEDEDEEDDKPRRRKRSRDEDEDDPADEDDDSGDDDEDEDEPRGKRKRRRGAEEDDDDEEEEGRRSRRVKSRR